MEKVKVAIPKSWIEGTKKFIRKDKHASDG